MMEILLQQTVDFNVIQFMMSATRIRFRQPYVSDNQTTGYAKYETKNKQTNGIESSYLCFQVFAYWLSLIVGLADNIMFAYHCTHSDCCCRLTVNHFRFYRGHHHLFEFLRMLSTANFLKLDSPLHKVRVQIE